MAGKKAIPFDAAFRQKFFDHFFTYLQKFDFHENHFSPWDYVVFAIVLGISSVIGLYYGCTGNKQGSTSEFLMAGRSMSVLPVALSLLASFMSAITLLGTPAEIVIYGTQYWVVWVSYFIVMPFAAYVFIPVFYQLQLTSVFEVSALYAVVTFYILLRAIYNIRKANVAPTTFEVELFA